MFRINLNPKIVSVIREALFSSTSYQMAMGMLGAALMLMLVHLFSGHQPVPIATVDITHIVNQFVQTQTKLNLPTDEVKKRVKIFGNQLEVTVNNIAKTRHVVLLPAEAVIAGAPDYTALVQNQLQQLQAAS